MSPTLSIGIFIPPLTLSSDLLVYLKEQGYHVYQYTDLGDFQAFLTTAKLTLDCLVLAETPELPAIATWLHGQLIALPAIILAAATPTTEPAPPPAASFIYHVAEVKTAITDIKSLEQALQSAIARFIALAPICWSKPDAVTAVDLLDNLPTSQQSQLIEKLKERLGYLGVYYKRDPNNFFRHLSSEAKTEFLDSLREAYREIILRYFQNDGTLNQQIDDFVNTAFFSDLSVAQIVEIHMDLMDEFAKQLKLEGRSEEILLDYRLTLIDTIAHLCEMYRRSIPQQP